jgi:hypothetical protein
MGRRWGKTVTGGDLTLSYANQGAAVAWVVPTYKNARPLWRFVVSALREAIQLKAVDVSISERVVSFPTGGWLGIYSAENDTSIRGEKFHLVVGDEASRFDEATVEEVIEPTVADYDGWILYLTTPAGRNWFWRKTMLAEEDGRRLSMKAFHAPTYANPNPAIRRAYEMAKLRLPELAFQQEWDAEFVDEGIGVFKGLGRVLYPTEAAEYADWLTALGGAPGELGMPGWRVDLPFGTPYPGTFVMGVDWGQLYDFTVFSVWDTRTMREVDLVRVNKISWQAQLDMLVALQRKWKCQAIYAESNAMGSPLIEWLEEEGYPIEGFETTNSSKKLIVENLALLIQTGGCWLANEPWANEEMYAFQMERLPGTGLIRYAAAAGEHDDGVMARCIASYFASKESPREEGDEFETLMSETYGSGSYDAYERERKVAAAWERARKRPSVPTVADVMRQYRGGRQAEE